jgi:3'(2'), 5'-bisphosphate nucleotidase
MNQFTSHLYNSLLAAKEAGRAILEIYKRDFDVWYKNDKSPLTMADQRSHDIIVAHMSDQTGDQFPILSEEGKDISFKQRSKWEYFWLVDPLDGTKEFVKRNGEFTVNIALVHRNRPVLGVVYVPVKDVLFFAAEGLGAYKSDSSDVLELFNGKASEKERAGLLRTLIDRSEKLPVYNSQITDSDSQLTIVGSRSHSTKELEDFVEAMKKKYELVKFISAGSSLKLCLVAEGKADVYPRLGPTMEWDTAAGQVIVEQAKGSVLNVETDEPLRYNKENLLNPWFIVRKKPA